MPVDPYAVTIPAPREFSRDELSKLRDILAEYEDELLGAPLDLNPEDKATRVAEIKVLMGRIMDLCYPPG